MDYNELGAFIAPPARVGTGVSVAVSTTADRVPVRELHLVIFGISFAASAPERVGVEFGSPCDLLPLHIFLKVSQAFGYNGDMDPLLTAWLANIVFLSAAPSRPARPEVIQKSYRKFACDRTRPSPTARVHPHARVQRLVQLVTLQ